MSKYLFFMMLIFAFFFPRLGIFDLGLFGTIITTSIVALIYRVRFSIRHLSKAQWLVLLLFNLSLASGINGWVQFSEAGSFFFAQKNIRLFMMIFCFSQVIKRLPISQKSIIFLMASALTLHLVFIFIQIAIPDSKVPIILFMTPSFSDWSPYRATGLANSHDVAGMYVVFLSILIFYFLENTPTFKLKLFNSFLVLSCFVATVLTARVALITFLSLIIFQYVFLKMAFFKPKTLLFVTGISILALVILKSMVALNPDYYFAIDRSLDYARVVRETNMLFDSFLILPTDFYSLMIGTGYPPYTSFGAKGDLGYGHPLWGTGLIGLILVVSLYFFIPLLKLKSIDNKKFPDQRLILLMVFVTLVASIKGPYLFGRGVFDILLITWMTLNRQLKTSDSKLSCFDVISQGKIVPAIES